MNHILKRIFYRILLYAERKKNEAKVYYQSKKILMGRGSKLDHSATVHNMQGDLANIIVGENSTIAGELLTFNYGGKIEIGNNSYVGTGTRIWSGQKITIGSDVLISHNVNIMDTTAHEIDYLERSVGYRNIALKGYPKNKGSIETSEIFIHDHVWISFNSTILRGVTIGKGAIVGANSVVTKDVPEHTLVAGNPAVIIKNLTR